MSNEDLPDDCGAFMGYNPFDNEPATPEEFMEFVSKRIDEYKSGAGYVALPTTWEGIEDTAVSNALSRMCAIACAKPYSGTTKLLDGNSEHIKPLDGVSLLSPYQRRADSVRQSHGAPEYNQLLDTLIKQVTMDISLMGTPGGVTRSSVVASYINLRKAASALSITLDTIQTVESVMVLAPDSALTAIIEETIKLVYAVASLIGTTSHSYDELIKKMHLGIK